MPTSWAFIQVMFTWHYAHSYAPLISLLAGILILVMPKLLNFIIAMYLIEIGLVG